MPLGQCLAQMPRSITASARRASSSAPPPPGSWGGRLRSDGVPASRPGQICTTPL